jgi:hypothetical protein
VDTFRTNVLSTVNVGLHVVAQVLLAMLGSAPINWACCQGMFILNVKATRITNIPVVIFLEGGGSIVAWGGCRGHRWWVWTIPMLDYSTWDKTVPAPRPPVPNGLGPRPSQLV